MPSVIVLGAKGRFGREAVRAFAAAGRSTVRAGRGLAGPGCVDVDATDVTALTRVCQGFEVIVHAVNPPYHEWSKTVPRVTSAVIAAARASGATVMIPGNVYNYGRKLPLVLREDAEWVGNTRKGNIRIRMEQAFRDSGVRTIVLRGGDFLATEDTGGWFETHIAQKAHLGRMMYPGPLDQVHAWAYLPDITRVMVALADRRHDFDTFEEFGFEGFSLTGHDLAQHVETKVGRPIRVSRLPWTAVRLMALWSPLMREVLEMRYLWNRPHRVDGSKLRAVLPDFSYTPVADAVAACVPDCTLAYGKEAKTV